MREVLRKKCEELLANFLMRLRLGRFKPSNVDTVSFLFLVFFIIFYFSIKYSSEYFALFASNFIQSDMHDAASDNDNILDTPTTRIDR